MSRFVITGYDWAGARPIIHTMSNQWGTSESDTQLGDLLDKINFGLPNGHSLAFYNSNGDVVLNIIGAGNIAWEAYDLGSSTMQIDGASQAFGLMVRADYFTTHPATEITHIALDGTDHVIWDLHAEFLRLGLLTEATSLDLPAWDDAAPLQPQPADAAPTEGQQIQDAEDKLAAEPDENVLEAGQILTTKENFGQDEGAADGTTPLEALFSGLFHAVVEAQRSIEALAFDTSMSRYFNTDGSPKTVSIQMPSHSDLNETRTVDVPLFTLVPHHSLATDEVTIELPVVINEHKAADGAPGSVNVAFSDVNQDKVGSIVIKFSGKDQPEGIAKINDRLLKLI